MNILSRLDPRIKALLPAMPVRLKKIIKVRLCCGQDVKYHEPVVEQDFFTEDRQKYQPELPGLSKEKARI